jgi:hypothetical protein
VNPGGYEGSEERFAAAAEDVESAERRLAAAATASR